MEFVEYQILSELYRVENRKSFSDIELGAAIGWLAHEDKIEIDMGNETSEQRFHYPYYNQFFDMSYKSQ